MHLMICSCPHSRLREAEGVQQARCRHVCAAMVPSTSGSSLWEAGSKSGQQILLPPQKKYMHTHTEGKTSTTNISRLRDSNGQGSKVLIMHCWTNTHSSRTACLAQCL